MTYGVLKPSFLEGIVTLFVMGLVLGICALLVLGGCWCRIASERLEVVAKEEEEKRR